MLKILIAAFSLFSFQTSFAAPSALYCKGEDKKTYQMSKKADFNSFWENCQDQVIDGKVCFIGKRSDIIKIISYLDKNDFLGDEYSFKNVHYVGKDRLTYSIYDGPNSWVLERHTITYCKTK